MAERLNQLYLHTYYTQRKRHYLRPFQLTYVSSASVDNVWWTTTKRRILGQGSQSQQQLH